MKTVEQKAQKLLKRLSKVKGVTSLTMRYDVTCYVYSYSYKGSLGEFFIYGVSFRDSKVKDLVSAVMYSTFGYYDRQL